MPLRGRNKYKKKKGKENDQDLLCINPNQEAQNKAAASEQVESMGHFNMDVITEIDESASARDELMNRLILEIKDRQLPNILLPQGSFTATPE